MAFSLIISIIWLIALIYMLYEVWIHGNKKLDMMWKIIWTVLALFIGPIAVIIYYIIYHVMK